MHFCVKLWVNDSITLKAQTDVYIDLHRSKAGAPSLSFSTKYFFQIEGTFYIFTYTVFGVRLEGPVNLGTHDRLCERQDWHIHGKNNEHKFME